MKIKDILVHLDQSAACKGRVETAILLARQHDACLRGVYIYTAPGMKNPAKDLEQVKMAFSQQVKDAGVASAWLAVDIGFNKINLVEMLSYQSCFTDLLVVTHPLVGGMEKAAPQARLARLLLGAGCPVLVVPADTTVSKLGERIMVAWKAGPKASRAIRDAGPLLAEAKYVHLVSVGKRPEFADEVGRLNDYLSCHQLTANIEQIPKSHMTVGDTLLNLAVDQSIDLLVVGVHITTRRGQFELGEVGNCLLRQLNVPMLLTS